MSTCGCLAGCHVMFVNTVTLEPFEISRYGQMLGQVRNIGSNERQSLPSPFPLYPLPSLPSSPPILSSLPFRPFHYASPYWYLLRSGLLNLASWSLRSAVNSACRVSGNLCIFWAGETCHMAKNVAIEANQALYIFQGRALAPSWPCLRVPMVRKWLHFDHKGAWVVI